MAYFCGHIKDEHQEQWENLVGQNIAGGFHQSFFWAKFKQLENWDTYKIGLFDDKTKKIVGGAVILQFNFNNGTNFLYIPEGPILDYQNEGNLDQQWKVLEKAIYSIADVSENKKTTHIRIEPRIEKCPSWFLSKFQKAPLNLQPRHTQQVDLSSTEDEILAQMKQKGRYNIRLAEKKSVQITQIKRPSPKDLKKFFDIYQKTFTRNKFEGKGIELFENLEKAAKAHSKIFFATHDDDILAGIYAIYFGDRVTYLYGGSSNTKRQLMAPYLLHWEVMKDAKASGYKSYDLWGIAPDKDDTEHGWHGITSFKKKLGGEQKDFIGAFDYIIQKDLYEAFLQKHEL